MTRDRPRKPLIQFIVYISAIASYRLIMEKHCRIFIGVIGNSEACRVFSVLDSEILFDKKSINYVSFKGLTDGYRRANISSHAQLQKELLDDLSKSKDIRKFIQELRTIKRDYLISNLYDYFDYRMRRGSFSATEVAYTADIVELNYHTAG